MAPSWTSKLSISFTPTKQNDVWQNHKRDVQQKALIHNITFLICLHLTFAKSARELQTVCKVFYCTETPLSSKWNFAKGWLFIVSFFLLYKELKTEKKTHHFVLLEYTKCSALSLKFIHVNRNIEQWRNIVNHFIARKREYGQNFYTALSLHAPTFYFLFDNFERFSVQCYRNPMLCRFIMNHDKQQPAQIKQCRKK